ncbi:MAG: hypothetical protein K5912_00030 [Alphaproteobacteria bacterium]|nr:hypothetical protein [Alphaproteobacteria bacterium]
MSKNYIFYRERRTRKCILKNFCIGVAVVGALMFVIGVAEAAIKVNNKGTEIYQNDDVASALRVVYHSCVGIDEDLSEIKTKAGIATGVSAAGTASSGGALATGIVKSNVDERIEIIEQKLAEIDKKTLQGFYSMPSEEEVQRFMNTSLTCSNITLSNSVKEDDEKTKLEKERDKLNTKSEKLGNWRTGLMATSTATNIASAAISGTNRIKPDLQAKISACRTSVSELRKAIASGAGSEEDLQDAQIIVAACGKYDSVDLKKINNRAIGATVSSSVGAGTGLSGTITSAIANSATVRNDNSELGKRKEKRLNIASNVLAGTTTVAGLTSTTFNATQIAAIKEVAEVAEECSGVLR